MAMGFMAKVAYGLGVKKAIFSNINENVMANAASLKRKWPGVIIICQPVMAA